MVRHGMKHGTKLSQPQYVAIGARLGRVVHQVGGRRREGVVARPRSFTSPGYSRRYASLRGLRAGLVDHTSTRFASKLAISALPAAPEHRQTHYRTLAHCCSNASAWRRR